MKASELIREARKRARLTQRELAEQLGTSQAVVARWETGRRSPSFDRTVEAVRACGLELSVRLVSPDSQHALMVEERLRLSPEERLERMTASIAGLEDLAANLSRRTK